MKACIVSVSNVTAMATEFAEWPQSITEEPNQEYHQGTNDIARGSRKANTATKSKVIEREAILDQDTHKTFGPWTITCRNRRRQPAHKALGDKWRSSENRFELLEALDEAQDPEQQPKKNDGDGITIGMVPAMLTSADKAKVGDASGRTSEAVIAIASTYLQERDSW